MKTIVLFFAPSILFVAWPLSASAQTLCVIAPGWPQGKLRPTILRIDDATEGNVQLIGHQGDLGFTTKGKRVTVEVPAQPPCNHAYAFKLTGFETSLTPEAAVARDEAFKQLQADLSDRGKAEGEGAKKKGKKQLIGNVKK